MAASRPPTGTGAGRCSASSSPRAWRRCRREIELFRSPPPHIVMHPPSPRPRALCDAALLDAVRGGDVAALGLLLERHRPSLLASATRLVGHGPEAEDA